MNMKDQDQYAWRNPPLAKEIIEQQKKGEDTSIKIKKTSDKSNCIPVSEVWSYNIPQKKIEEKNTEDDCMILSGHAGLFFLVVPGAGLSIAQLSLMGGFIFFSLLVLFFLFKRHSRKRKINKFLEAKNLELAEEDEEIGFC